MKKLLVVLLALVVIGSFASAQVTFGSWSRIGVSLYTQPASTAAATSALFPGWGKGGFTFNVTKDNAGIVADLTIAADGTVSVGDNIQAFAKLFDGMATLHLGKTFGDALRGKIGGGSAVGTTQAGDEDAIYTRFKANKGLFLELKPVDGLFVGAVVNTAALASDAFEAVQAGVGYTLKDIGLVRAGYYGDAASGDFIQAAFAYTGMAGLTADLGFKFYSENANAAIPVTVAVKYGKDALNVMFRTQASIATAFDMAFGAYANYKVADTMVVGADLGLNSISANMTANVTPYLQYNIPGGGSLNIGFNMALGLSGQPFGFAIPIVITI